MKAPLFRFWRRVLAGLVLTGLAALAWWRGGPTEDVSGASRIDRPARIQPDYGGLVIPPNIAPLNFSMLEEGTRYYVVVRGNQGAPIQIRSRGPAITIPPRAWQALIQLNQGGELYCDLYANTGKNGWQRFSVMTNAVALEPIDPYLFYRKLYPYHNSWSSMGLYQRSLESYDERPLLRTDCCHCHSLCNNDPNRFSVDIRSEHYGNSLLLVQNGTVQKLTGTVGFSSWHPTGRLLASSFNKPRLLLHSRKNDMRDIVEFEAWLGYLWVGSNVVRRIPSLADDTRLLTCPTWSPDGRYLYFCSAPRRFKDFAELFRSEYQQVKYDLMRVAYDVERDRWGAPEMVLPVQATGLSAAQPRISPDGRWLTFCLCAYGCWPTYHPESDLYLIDLNATGPFVPRKLEINSEECESWHSWSSNSRWMVFSSKRGNPLFNRPYLAHVDAQGKFSKPFVVPQADPAFYSAYLKTFTLPVLATQPLPVTERDLIRAISTTNGPQLRMPSGDEDRHPDSNDHNQSLR